MHPRFLSPHTCCYYAQDCAEAPAALVRLDGAGGTGGSDTLSAAPSRYLRRCQPHTALAALHGVDPRAITLNVTPANYVLVTATMEEAVISQLVGSQMNVARARRTPSHGRGRCVRSREGTPEGDLHVVCRHVPHAPLTTGFIVCFANLNAA